MSYTITVSRRILIDLSKFFKYFSGGYYSAQWCLNTKRTELSERFKPNSNVRFKNWQSSELGTTSVASNFSYSFTARPVRTASLQFYTIISIFYDVRWKKKKNEYLKKKKLGNLNSNVTHVRLYGCRSLRPSGSCKSDMRLLLFRRTTNRFHTVPMSMFRWCTSRIGRSSRDEGTFVHRVFPGIATIVPRCILGTGSLENVIDLKTNIHFRYT